MSAAEPLGRFDERWTKQLERYEAFIPRSLRRLEPILVDSEVGARINKTTLELGKLYGLASTIPDEVLDAITHMSARIEAKESSAVEGINVTLTDLIRAEVRCLEHEHTLSEVLYNLKALRQALKVDTLSVALILDIHRWLFEGQAAKGNSPGVFRMVQNWVGGPNSTITTARYVPPPFKKVEKKITSMCNYFNDTNTQTKITLLKIIYCHVFFENVHPFSDGNGRVGRVLISWSLAREQQSYAPVLFISHYLSQHRRKYSALIHSTTMTGDWQAIIEFFCDALEHTCKTEIEILTKTRDLFKAEDAQIRTQLLGVLKTLRRQPVFTVQFLVTLLGKDENSVMADLAELSELQIVSKFEIDGRELWIYKSFLGVVSAFE